jgi:hypothetical protein
MPDLSEKELDALAKEATVDAYGDDEQLSGFAVMIEENLKMPFETTALGVQVTVTGHHPDRVQLRRGLRPRRTTPGDRRA